MARCEIRDGDREEVARFIELHWQGRMVMSSGKAFYPHQEHGFFERRGGEIVGLLTYHVEDHCMEILTLNSTVEGQGIGLCVDPENPRAIADAVNRIAGDDALRNRMKENCLRLAKERWNWESEFARLHDAYAALPQGLTVRAAGAQPAHIPVG